MSSSTEFVWSRYAIDNNIISRSQLQLCIDEQSNLKDQGVEKSLAGLMVEHGFVDASILRDVVNLKNMIPGYTISQILGVGGLGVVYKAYSEKLQTEVAIKILNPEHTDNPIILKRFSRESSLSQTLNHPNIVKGFDAGNAGSLYYLVLEYINGVNLENYVLRLSPLSEDQIVYVADIVTNALHYAWQKGLTHRDIKPENIMLTQSGLLKVCDFGLAKLADVNVALTMSGTIVGSPRYLSPEQVVNSGQIDYRSDIYSLGATLYFLLTGKFVFDAKTFIAICNAHINETPLLPSTHLPVSKPVEQLILKMLSKEPDARCKTPEEFLNLLKFLKKGRKPATFKVLPPEALAGENSYMSLEDSLDMMEDTAVEKNVASLPQKAKSPIPQAAKKSTTIQPPSTPSPLKPSTSAPLLSPTLALAADEKNSFSQKPASKSKPGSSTGSSTSTKTKMEDAILQQLLLSLNIIQMSEFSQCLAEQVQLQLQGIQKPMREIIEEKGYITPQEMQNLRFLRDKDGRSFIPNHEIVKPIGEGGIAAVYMGHNITTHETVAIKIFAPNTNESSAIARFVREAEAAKKLDHPNIVKATDFGNVHGIYYIIMEWVPGFSLAHVISKWGRLDEAKTLAMLEKLADALGYAWKQNIIHRDIKPGNILSDGDTLKICDFGLAKVLESEIELTQDGNIVGTPQFMSPEQSDSSKTLDYRTDIYSLGVTAYMMLTGQCPFSASSNIAMAQARLNQSPPPFEQFNVSIGKPVKALVMKMLAKDRNKRAQNMDELLEDVRRVRNGKFPQNVASGTRNYMVYSGVALGVALLILLITSTVLVLQQNRAVSDKPPAQNPDKPVVNTSSIKGEILWAKAQKQIESGQYDKALQTFDSLLSECTDPIWIEKAKQQKDVVRMMSDNEEAKILWEKIRQQVAAKEYETALAATQKLLAKYTHLPFAGDAKQLQSQLVAILQKQTDEQQHLLAMREQIRQLLAQKEYKKALQKYRELADKKISGIADLHTAIKSQVCPPQLAIVVAGVKFELVLMAPGKFEMGTPENSQFSRPDEKLHWVNIEKPFYMAKYETTNQQYSLFGEKTAFPNHLLNCPIIDVSCEKAFEFCKWLSEKTHMPVRLPSEAEWEYACKAGTTTNFFWGDEARKESANYTWEQDWITKWNTHAPVAVGSYPPNAWGLYDMHGNVWEWVGSSYSVAYDGEETKVALAKYMVVKGGGWNQRESSMRSSYRTKSPATKKNPWTGFRIAVEIDPQYLSLFRE